jgi:dihydroorotase-like cyclic amidohydrolase
MRTRFFNLRIPGESNVTEAVELVVDEGRFEEVLPAGTVTAAGDEQWVDLEGALVLPGVIDGHVHFDDPGFTHREDFASGTSAAAAGGVTCVVDMPCTSLPPVVTKEALENKLKIIGPKAHVDYMLWGGVSGNALTDRQWRRNLADLVDAGVAAIKVYMLSGMDTFRDLTTAEIGEVLVQTHKLGIPVGVHAEDRAIVNELTERAKERGDDSPAAYAAARPAAAEASAVMAAVDAARKTGARVHIVHLASGEALDVISAARLENLPVSAETCPQYLQFTKPPGLRRNLPPVPPVHLGGPRPSGFAAQDRTGRQERRRSSTAVAGIGQRRALVRRDRSRRGTMARGKGDGLDLDRPYLWSEGVVTGRITVQRLTELLASEPARFFGVDHRKGWLRPGCDADFVVFDEGARWTVRADALHNLNRYTPLDGFELTGRVRSTFVRGNCVFERRPEGTEFFAPAGTGKWVRRGVA